jgi:hypothetical protein
VGSWRRVIEVSASDLLINHPQSEPSAQRASNFLATELWDPFRAFTCTHKPYYGKIVSRLLAGLGAQLDSIAMLVELRCVTR